MGVDRYNGQIRFDCVLLEFVFLRTAGSKSSCVTHLKKMKLNWPFSSSQPKDFPMQHCTDSHPQALKAKVKFTFEKLELHFSVTTGQQ